MSYLSKCASRVTTGIFAVAFALSLAPPGSAQSAVQAPGDSAGAGTSAAPASSTQQQIDDLQKEMAALEQQIAALKAQVTQAPSVEAASYSVQTTPAPAAQAPAPAAAPAAPAAVNLAGLLGPMTISGTGDVYYGYDYNHPISGTNPSEPFNQDTNSFGLNLAEFIVDKAADTTSAESRLGYHFAAAYGQAAAAVNGSDVAGDGSQFYIKEAYFDYIAPVGKGLTVSVGKFVTPIGNEVIETSGNWNYSRSFLFYNAIPFFHFGASAKYTWNPKVAATFYLVNGWNNSAISHEAFSNSTGLTYGASFAYTPNAKWSATENYFAGPVLDDQTCDFDVETSNCTALTDWKQLSDTVIAYTPNAKWAFALNGDYGFGPHDWNCTESTTIQCATVGPQATWWGVAGYGKYTINPKSYFAVRYEYYNDPEGYSLSAYEDNNPADRLHLWEVTSTYSYNVTSALQVRAEYRYDWASQRAFQQGSNPDSRTKDENTATLGFIYSFSSANAK
jgi:TolA-binding protein